MEGNRKLYVSATKGKGKRQKQGKDKTEKKEKEKENGKGESVIEESEETEDGNNTDMNNTMGTATREADACDEQ